MNAAETSESVQVSIVVPLYNEQESVGPLVDSITKAVRNIDLSFEIILVDDGSTDRTWTMIESLADAYPGLRGIKFRRNFGQTSAMVAGFEHARGWVIVTLDGDLQNDPADIPILLDKISEGYDIVSGWRKNRQDHFSRVLPSRVANYMISATTGVRLHDYGCSLKAYRSECVKSLNAYGEMHRFFPALASMTGARVTEVEVNHYPRQYGVSKYGFNRIFKVFSDIFAMNLIIKFSSSPLKGFTLCAIPFFFLSVLFALLSVLTVLLGWTPGKGSFFMLASGLCVISVIYLIILGVLGELVVSTSDLTHARLPEISKKEIYIRREMK
ncbi:MAG: glycosyltransferase family 2 protein [Desulfobacterales bacterium]|nr:glycosyltransferase family 2 protein [Desulfobacterales bacterium]